MCRLFLPSLVQSVSLSLEAHFIPALEADGPKHKGHKTLKYINPKHIVSCHTHLLPSFELSLSCVSVKERRFARVAAPERERERKAIPWREEEAPLPTRRRSNPTSSWSFTATRAKSSKSPFDLPLDRWGSSRYSASRCRTGCTKRA